MTRHPVTTLTRPAVYTQAEVAALPGPVRRYLTTAIGSGAPLATTARLRMRGHLRLGRWLPYRATETVSPHDGFRRAARIAGVISGSDWCATGHAALSWRVLGLAPLLRAAGPDLARSAAGRAAAAGIWVPTALLPRFGVVWHARDDQHLVARMRVGETMVTLQVTVDGVGRPSAVTLDRWGDPDGSGVFGWHRFGIKVTDHATFGDVTVPCAGRIGWHAGTHRWPEGEFLRFRITSLEPLLWGPDPGPAGGPRR